MAPPATAVRRVSPNNPDRFAAVSVSLLACLLEEISARFATSTRRIAWAWRTSACSTDSSAFRRCSSVELASLVTTAARLRASVTASDAFSALSVAARDFSSASRALSNCVDSEPTAWAFLVKTADDLSLASSTQDSMRSGTGLLSDQIKDSVNGPQHRLAGRVRAAQHRGGEPAGRDLLLPPHIAVAVDRMPQPALGVQPRVVPQGGDLHRRRVSPVQRDDGDRA